MKWHELPSAIRDSCVRSCRKVFKHVIGNALVERLEARCADCRYFEPFPSGSGLCGNAESVDGHVEENFMCAAFVKRAET